MKGGSKEAGGVVNMMRSPAPECLLGTFGKARQVYWYHIFQQQDNSKCFKKRNKQHQNTESKQHQTKQGFAYKLRKVKIDSPN